MFYWTLAWTLNNDSITFRSWGIQFALAIIQDVFVSQPMKVFAIHVAVIQVIRNQIRQIFNVLKTLSLADHKDKVETMIGFPDVRVVQFMSAACRASRTKGISKIPAARVLMKLGDYEFSLCREMRNARIGVLFLSIIILPSLLAFADTRLQEVVLDVLLRSAWNGFLLVNAVLLTISPGLLAAPYILLFLFLSYRIYKQRRIHRKRRSIGRCKSKDRVQGWRVALRGKKSERPGTAYPKPTVFDQIYSFLKLIKKAKSRVANEELIWRNMNFPNYVRRRSCMVPVSNSCSPDISRRVSNASSFSLDERVMSVKVVEEISIEGVVEGGDNGYDEKSKAAELFVRKNSGVFTSVLTRALSDSLAPMPLTPERASYRLQQQQQQQQTRAVEGRLCSDSEEDGSPFGDEIEGGNAHFSIASVPHYVLGRSRGRVTTPSAVVENWRRTRKDKHADEILKSAESFFALMDADCDGLLSGGDLDNLCDWVWSTFYLTDATPTKTELDEVLDRLLCYMDPNHTGVICFPDFLIWFRTMAHHLTTLAQDYDATGTGTL